MRHYRFYYKNDSRGGVKYSIHQAVYSDQLRDDVNAECPTNVLGESQLNCNTDSGT